MLRISRKVDYSLSFLMELAKRPGEWVSLADVSKTRGISSKFLSQMATSLKGAGMVVSREGVGGGYKLSKSPRVIKVREVVAALEGELAVVDCLAAEDSPCPAEKFCVQREMWKQVQGQFDRVLGQYSLADFSKEDKRKS